MQHGPFWHKNTDALALLGLTLMSLVAALLAYAPDDIPLIDGWTYAWSVEHWLRTGELRVLDWSAHYPLAQILWAGVFARVGGFSFAVLRVSTLVLGWLGLVALYLTLRAVRVQPLPSALGTCALLYNPVFFVLQHSFMTDVPFLCAMNIAVLGYTLWGQQGRTGWLGLGSTCALLAFLIRQIGAVLPLLPLLVLLLDRWRGERRVLPWPQVLWLLVPFLGIGLTLWWMRHVHGLTSAYILRTEPIEQFFSVSWWLSPHAWWSYFDGLVHALGYVSLMLWPLALGSLWGRPRGFVVLACAGVVAVTGVYLWHVGALPQVLHYGETLSLEELGASRPLLPPKDVVLSHHLPSWAAWALRGLAVISCSAIVAVLLEALWRRHRPGTVLMLNSLLQFAIIEALWLYYDRYYLPLLPGLTALLLGAMPRSKVTQTVVGTGIFLCAVVSVSGTIDNFRFNRAVAQARTWLVQQQVAPWQIDAGYVLNGWWLYAHPENLPPGARPESDVQHVTTQVELPYSIANVPLPSHRVLHVITWPTLWAVSDRIYVLQRTAPP